MSFDLSKATPQDVFDAVVYAKPSVIRALILGFSSVAEHMDHIVEHEKYPEQYWDDVQAVASEHGFEFVHPKFAKGPTLVETSPTVH